MTTTQETRSLPVPEEVGALYDRYTALGAASIGQNLHFGYWDPEDADVPFDEAADLLTDLMAGRLRLRSGDRVLDLGCGVGTPGTHIALTNDVDVTGISVSQEQIWRARDLAKTRGVADRARFELHDAMQLGFPDESFDAVIALESIIHMPDRAKVLAQVFRVLKPGGRMVLTDFHERSPIPQPGRAAVDRYLRDFMMTTVDPADYPRMAWDTGLWLEELRDISDQTLRRTFVELSRRLRAGKAELGAEHGDELVDTFDPGDLVDVPEFGYLLVVLRKPPSRDQPPSLPSAGQEIGVLYDRMTDLMTSTHGGYQHGGLWSGANPASSSAEAGDRLTDRVGNPLAGARGGRLLDVGCGSGKAALRLAHRLDVAVTGITLSEYEAQLARQGAVQNPPPRGAAFSIADMRDLPFEAGYFDAASAIESICHLPDRAEAFREIGRVLRPGGLLSLTDFVLRRPIDDPRRREIVETQLRRWNQGPILSQAEYQAAARQAGLEVVAFDDLGEEVRPSWQHAADNLLATWRQIPGLDDSSATMVEELAGQLRSFGATTELGYAHVVLRVPVSSEEEN